MLPLGLVLALALAAGCHRQPAPGATNSLDRRPYRVQVPAGSDPTQPIPVVVVLHALGATAAWQAEYFGLPPLADGKRFLLVLPDGTSGSDGGRFWNATDACCDFEGRGVDDVRYLDQVLDDVGRRHPIDRKRVYLVGLSNGGFLAHRYACERAPRVAAFVSVAGANWMDAGRCRPSEPVAALQVHGDADRVVLYQGGRLGGGLPQLATYPSARASLQPWLSRNRCREPAMAAPPSDLDADVAGAETARLRWPCEAGAVELWTLRGSGHIPRLQPAWGAELWAFLSAHPKP